MRKKIYILLAILWMGIIFYMSNQPATISSIYSGNTINIISKLPLIGNIMDYLTSINIGEFIVRKSAHIFSFCILSILLFMSIYKENIYKCSIISFLCTFLYACSDEFHQLFIPGRSGEFRDVMIDSIGAIIGILIISFIIKYSNIKKIKNSNTLHINKCSVLLFLSYKRNSN